MKTSVVHYLLICAYVSMFAPTSTSLASEDDAMQVVADVALIGTTCRHYAVNSDKLFAYAKRNGIEPGEILPLGLRRPAFSAAYRSRSRLIPEDLLCADLADERQLVIPGVFERR